MTAKHIFILASLAIGVLSQPVKAPNTSSANIFSRDVPRCGAAMNTKCGMNVCCSGSNYCGTSTAHCAASSCQSAFGSCKTPTAKKCGTNSGTTNGRAIGYYRGADASKRSCHDVPPSKIDTSKFTHLYYAFASFDASFNVVPGCAADEAIYPKFTALKSSKLQTWIAVGGGAASTPWSSMVSTKTTRAKFIASIKMFMTKWGFQGVDLDWEAPNNIADREGYLSLVKEMKTAFASGFKISMAMPVDYGDMFWIDAKGMAPHLDSIGYMAYDQKNPDGTVSAHTDLVKTAEHALPLWAAGVDPAKINLGLASYGRGFTLASTSCTDLKCAVKGPSKSGACIKDSTGVMANFDIFDIIASKKLTPKLNTSGMFKQITFDDQWIAYDDAETIALKKGFGNDYCYGGTMQWSIDLGNF